LLACKDLNAQTEPHYFSRAFAAIAARTAVFGESTGGISKTAVNCASAPWPVCQP
jgi:hypothetical protein